MSNLAVKPKERDKISAFVVCMNEERNIRRCLESLKWCDEIVVIDSGSTDETLTICREYTSKVIVRPWAGYVGQKSFGLEQCSHPWVLNVDSDEEVSNELREEILEILSRNGNLPRPASGYYLPRVVFYLGRWWKKGGWHPEFRLRLMRREQTSWGGNEPHERAVVSGNTAKLRSELRHFTYSDITEHVSSLNNFSNVSAQTMYERGERSSIIKMAINPWARFMKFYFLKRGFLEGKAGLIVAMLEGYYVFLKYSKLWALEHGRKSAKDSETNGSF